MSSHSSGNREIDRKRERESTHSIWNGKSFFISGIFNHYPVNENSYLREFAVIPQWMNIYIHGIRWEFLIVWAELAKILSFHIKCRFRCHSPVIEWLIIFRVCDIIPQKMCCHSSRIPHPWWCRLKRHSSVNCKSFFREL